MPETFTYRVIEGCSVKLDVYRPGGPSPAPIIIWIHGGALIGGGRNSMQAVVRALLADAGFAQVSIDYRLAPETKLPDIIGDVREAFRWVTEDFPRQCSVDPNRFGVIGGSAGGYLTLMTGFAVAPRPRALVSLYGYGDITGPWYSAPDAHYLKSPLVTEEEARSVIGAHPVSEQIPGGPDRFRFYLWCRQNGLWPKEIAGFDPKTEDAAFTPFSPERNVTPEYPPTLLLHGNADTDVPYERSVDMASALQRQGVTHELITIDGGPHGFDGKVKLKNWPAMNDTPESKALLRAVEWFKKYV